MRSCDLQRHPLSTAVFAVLVSLTFSGTALAQDAPPAGPAPESAAAARAAVEAEIGPTLGVSAGFNAQDGD